MRALLAMSILLAATLVNFPANAHGTWTHCGALDVPSGGYYYVAGHVYEETNTVPNLQRGGSSPVVPDDSDSCYEATPFGPDLLVS